MIVGARLVGAAVGRIAEILGVVRGTITEIIAKYENEHCAASKRKNS